MEYSHFARNCVNDLKTLQDQLQMNYELTWYENWFYNQATGLLTLSSDNKEVNFKYVCVGSFSKKVNTWKWSWDNDHTLNNVKERAWQIREFGEKAGFQILTKGTFESSEIDAWEFAAIGVKVLNGIGVYRPVNDKQLQLFLVLTEFVDQQVAQAIKDRYVDCDVHESRRRAFVCQHLNRTTKSGFEEAFETFENMELGEDEDFQAWCDECESVRQKEGEWNDKSMAFADIKLICEKCYFELKEFNLKQ